MSLKLLVLIGIERVFNIFFYRHSMQTFLHQRLNGKIVRIDIKGFAIPIVLVFGDNQLDVLDKWEGKVDCSITTHICMLPKLGNRQEVAALIYRGELKVEGDPQVIDNFIALIDLAESDPTEIFAPYIGDIATESIRKVFLEGLMFFRKIIQRHQRYIADVITEELCIAPGKIEVAWLTEEITTIDYAIKTFIKRLKRLEDG